MYNTRSFGMFPPAIKNLMLASLAVYLTQWLVAPQFDSVLSAFLPGDYQEFINRGGLPSGISAFTFLFALTPNLVLQLYVWQIFTYIFLHGSFNHILFNMIALWMFGRELEHEWGTREFLRYFIMTGVIAGLSIFAWNTVRGDLIGLTYGASGAVCAVIAAYALFYPEKYIYFNFFIPVKVKYFAVFYVLLELWALPARDGISHIGHLGGMVAGYFYILNKYRHLGIGQNFFRDFFKKKGFQ